MIGDEIDSYFKLKEWRYFKDAENIWHTGFRSRIKSYQRNFEIFVVLLDEWVYIRVPLLVVDNQDCWHYLTEYLLGLNHSLFLAKMVLQNRQLLLTIELPIRSNVTDLDEAIMAMDAYTKSYYLDIETMATCPDTAAFVHTAIQGRTTSELYEAPEPIPEIIFND